MAKESSERVAVRVCTKGHVGRMRPLLKIQILKNVFLQLAPFCRQAFERVSGLHRAMGRDSKRGCAVGTFISNDFLRQVVAKSRPRLRDAS